MLILYFHILQGDFNAIFHASVYVKAFTAIVYYNMYHCQIFLKFLVFELLMYGKNISISGIKTIQLFKKSVVITGSIEFDIALTLMLC